MASNFYSLVNNPIAFNAYLFLKLPAAFFSGVKLKSVGNNASAVSIRYKWFTTNPFRSTYFACLSMAAEMSTGILAMSHVYKQKPAVSMLVTQMEANFYKKAVGAITFSCTDGEAFEQAIAATKQHGEQQQVVAKSIGVDKQGNLVASFSFTWSFKRKAT